MGDDICVLITGGEAHLGGVTVASPKEAPITLSLGTHKEGYVTERATDILRVEYAGSFAVCSGIHYDDITQQEIVSVLELSGELTRALCRRLNREKG
jgi:hypothetical protein